MIFKSPSACTAVTSDEELFAGTKKISKILSYWKFRVPKPHFRLNASYNVDQSGQLLNMRTVFEFFSGQLKSVFTHPSTPLTHIPLPLLISQGKALKVFKKGKGIKLHRGWIEILGSFWGSDLLWDGGGD